MFAKDIMTRDVAFVTCDARVSDVARILIDKGISAVPVVDDNHAPIGMVSEADLISTGERQRDARAQWWLAQLAEGQPLNPKFLSAVQSSGRFVYEIMATPVISVADTAEVEEIAQILETHRIKRVVVVNSGKMVGLISRADIVRMVAVEKDAPRLAALAVEEGRLLADTHRPVTKRSRRSSTILTEGGAGSSLSAHSSKNEDAAAPANEFLRKFVSVPANPSSATGVAFAPKPNALDESVEKKKEEGLGKRFEVSFTADAFRAIAETFETEERRQRTERHRVALELRKQKVNELAKRSLTDTAWEELLHNARRAATKGMKEYMLIRFPAQLCSDGGRAINAPDPNWPATLRGEPADVFSRWFEELRPKGFQLAAQIIDFPDGMPGDAGLILLWSQ
jgi:predicted transcriptional regulator